MILCTLVTMQVYRGSHLGPWCEREQRRVDERYDSLLGQYSEQQVS